MSKDEQPDRLPIEQSFDSFRQRLIDRTNFDIETPIVLVDPKFFQQKQIEINQKIATSLGNKTEGVVAVTATPEILSFISLTREQELRLRNGDQVLLLIDASPLREKRPSGGQPLDEVEKQIKQALSINLYILVERLIELSKIRKGMLTPQKETHRDMILNSLTEIWPKTYHTKYDFEARKGRFNTLLTNGRKNKSGSPLYAIENINQEIKNWAIKFAGVSKERLDQEIRFQHAFITSLLICEFRSKKIRTTLSELGDLVADGKVDNKGMRATLSATHPEDTHSFSDLLPAAFAGNINPSKLFPRIKIAEQYFEAVQLVGCLQRGHRVKITLDHLGFISPGLKYLNAWNKNPWPEITEESKQAAFWAKAMESVMSASDWRSLISASQPDIENYGYYEIQLRNR